MGQCKAPDAKTARCLYGCPFCDGRHPSFMGAPACMQASFRWNDNGSRNGFVVIPAAPLPCLPNSWLQPPSSFRRRPQSSDLDKPFPHSGNGNKQERQPTRHLIKPAPFTTPASPSSATCSRRRSTTYIPVGVDSSIRCNDDRGGNGVATILTAPLLCLTNS